MVELRGCDLISQDVEKHASIIKIKFKTIIHILNWVDIVKLSPLSAGLVIVRNKHEQAQECWGPH